MTTDHYLGVDVHKRTAQDAVLDDEGEVTEEVRVEYRRYRALARGRKKLVDKQSDFKNEVNSCPVSSI